MKKVLLNDDYWLVYQLNLSEKKKKLRQHWNKSSAAT
jgi:hypothetical protein